MASTNRQPENRVAGILLVASLLFVADLFLGWQRAGVFIADVVDVHATRSGWSGWGLVAGLLALVIAGLAAVTLRRGVGRPGVTLVAAIGMLIATALAIPTEGQGADVVMPMMAVHVGAARWPAWVGLGLAILVAAVALAAFIASARSTVRPLWRTPPAPPSPQ